MKLFEQITTHRSLEPDKGYVSMTHNHHGSIWAEGATIDEAMQNLIAKVKKLRTPPREFNKGGRQNGPRDINEWAAEMGDWFE